MKTLQLALMAAVAIAAIAPPAFADQADDEAAAIARAVAAANAGTYNKSTRARSARAPRNTRTARATWQATRAAGTKKLQLPEYKPYYSAKTGSYIPTTFIYQKTNGEFKILRPTAASSAAPKTGQGGVNAALTSIRNAPGGRPAAPAGGNAAPVQPPEPPAVQPAGASSSGGIVAPADQGPNVPRSSFP